MKSKNIAALVESLTAVARDYAASDQLQARIAAEVIKAARPLSLDDIPEGGDNMVYFVLDAVRVDGHWILVQLMEYNDEERVLGDIMAKGFATWMAAMPVFGQDGIYRLKGLQVLESDGIDYRVGDFFRHPDIPV